MTSKGESLQLWPAILIGMAERFAYYGLRSLLVLILVTRVDVVNPGAGWEREQAFSLYRMFIDSLAFGLILAGFAIDLLLSVRGALVIGMSLIALGFLLLIAFATTTQVEPLVYMGLTSIVAGIALTRPATMLAIGDTCHERPGTLAAALYGFQYLAISIVGIFAPFLIATIGDRFAWSWGLTASLAVLLLAMPLLFIKTKQVSLAAGPATSAGMTISDWLVPLAPIGLFIVAGLVSALGDARVGPLYATRELITVFGTTFSPRMMMMIPTLAAPLLAILLLTFFLTRKKKPLPILTMLVLAAGLFSVAALLFAWKIENVALPVDGPAFLFVLLTGLLAELLIFVPLMARIAGSVGFQFRATAIAVVLACPLLISRWLAGALADLPSQTSWLITGIGIVIFLVAAIGPSKLFPETAELFPRGTACVPKESVLGVSAKSISNDHCCWSDSPSCGELA